MIQKLDLNGYSRPLNDASIVGAESSSCENGCWRDKRRAAFLMMHFSGADSAGYPKD